VPRARSLTLSGIAAAALAVLDRDQLPGLSMRAVAGELGMGTMSLYRYVTGREHLEQLIVDLVLDGVDVDVPDGAPWAEKVALLANRVRAVAGRHPAAVPLLLATRHSSAGSVRWGEAMLGALTEGGFDGTDRVIAFRTVLSYVFGAVQVEHHSPLTGTGTAALAALPADDFPLLAATATTAREVGPDDEFRLGLAVVIRGLRPGNGIHPKTDVAGGQSS
jgi:AcrR family transcriptional regulator